MKERILNLLGFAQKSGNVLTGENTCEIYLKKRKVKLLIVSEDISENSLNKLMNLASTYKVKVYQFGNRDELSSAIGKCNRTAVGIKNEGFKKSLIKLFDEMGLAPIERVGGD